MTSADCDLALAALTNSGCDFVVGGFRYGVRVLSNGVVIGIWETKHRDIIGRQSLTVVWRVWNR